MIGPNQSPTTQEIVSYSLDLERTPTTQSPHTGDRNTTARRTTPESIPTRHAAPNDMHGTKDLASMNPPANRPRRIQPHTPNGRTHHPSTSAPRHQTRPSQPDRIKHARAVTSKPTRIPPPSTTDDPRHSHQDPQGKSNKTPSLNPIPHESVLNPDPHESQPNKDNNDPPVHPRSTPTRTTQAT